VAIVSALVAAGIVLIPGAPLLAMTLTVNVIATLLMASALLLLLLLVNDRCGWPNRDYVPILLHTLRNQFGLCA
jgi:hypothetical protein